MFINITCETLQDDWDHAETFVHDDSTATERQGRDAVRTVTERSHQPHTHLGKFDASGFSKALEGALRALDPTFCNLLAGKPGVFKVFSALPACVVEVDETGHYGHTNLFVFTPGALRCSILCEYVTVLLRSCKLVQY